jgi:hypothetical protein
VARPISGWSMAAAIDGVIETMNFNTIALTPKICAQQAGRTDLGKSFG